MTRLFRESVGDVISPDHIYNTIAPVKGQFLAVFMVMLLASYGVLAAVDFLPEPPTEQVQGVASSASDSIDEDEAMQESSVVHVAAPESDIASETSDATTAASNDSRNTTATVAESAALPVRLRIDALDRDVTILNPTSRAVADLDAALTRGAVRHPDAADFQREGNIFILGHSSHLPNVINRNFQIFNGIERLQWGDIIRVYSADTEYIYRVDRVYDAQASALVIPIAGTGPRLTLVTCDSFGAIEDRFIVEAELQSSRPL